MQYRFNERVRQALKDDADTHVIGIDRGERNLIYVSVINGEGKIVEQFSMNTIIDGCTGVLEYPTLRQTSKVELTDVDREMIAEMGKKIEGIIEADECPSLAKKRLCKNCSYYDFCYSNEPEDL